MFVYNQLFATPEWQGGANLTLADSDPGGWTPGVIGLDFPLTSNYQLLNSDSLNIIL